MKTDSGASSGFEGRVGLEETTEAIFNGVMRAIEARANFGQKFPNGVFIYGIIWDPYRGGIIGQPGEQGLGSGTLGDISQPS